MDIEGFEQNAGEASRLLTAMSNRSRLLILCHLVTGELTVAELAGRVDLSQSALSQHLAKLRALNLVEGHRTGQSVRYQIVSAPARRVIDTLYDIYCAPAGRPPKRRASD